MPKMFDIRPPKPVSKKQIKYTKSKKSKNGLLLIIFIICVFILIFSLSNNTSSQYSQSDQKTENSTIDNLATTEETEKPNNYPFVTPSKTESDLDENSDIEEDETNENTSENILIIVKNGARIPGVANNIKKILENNNIPVTEVGNTESLYSQTIIYYTKDNLKLAEKIEETLSEYNPILENNTDFADSEKILVVVGDNE